MKRPFKGLHIDKWRRSTFGYGIAKLIIRPFPIALTVFIYSFSANAVTISGEVYDVRSGLPLTGVRLTCYDSAAVSEEDGSFILSDILPGERLLRALYDGYAVYEGLVEVTADSEELWLNLPMFPLRREATSTNEDFLRFFKREATVIDKEPGKWYRFPLIIAFAGEGFPLSDTTTVLKTLNEELGRSFFKIVDQEEAEIVFVSNGEETLVNFAKMPVIELSGDINKQKKQLRAALLLAILNGKTETAGLKIKSDWERVDEELEDYISAARIVTSLGPGFDYDNYRYGIKDGNGLLFSFAGGPAHYTKTGWSNPRGEGYYPPINMGMAGLSAGIGMRLYGFVGEAGVLMITGLAALEGEEHDGLIITDYSHNFRAYGGGVGYDIPVKYGYLSVCPSVGWQEITIDGKYEAVDTDDSAIFRRTEKKEALSGPYGGLKASLFTPWAKVGGYVEYRHIRADGFIHYVDIGLGQAQWRGFGVYLNWRQYWNDKLSYVLVGIGMNGEIGLFN